MAKIIKTNQVGGIVEGELILYPILINLEHVISASPITIGNRKLCQVKLVTNEVIRVNMSFDKFAEVINCFDAVLTGEE